MNAFLIIHFAQFTYINAKTATNLKIYQTR